MGDNPTAGGAGDVTWTLDKILKMNQFKRTSRINLCFNPGPDLISNAIKAGIGNNVVE